MQDLVTQIVDLINTNEILLPLSNQNSFYSTLVLANALVNHIAVKAPEKTLTMIHSSYNQLIELQNAGAHLLTNTGNVFAGQDTGSNLHYIWNYAMMHPTTQLKSNTEVRNGFYSQAISKLRRDVTFQTQVQNLPITIANLTKENGNIIVGFYNRIGRIRTFIRQFIFKYISKNFAIFLDPYLRNKNFSLEKRMAWIRDQYQHPLETSFTFDNILNWFSNEHIKFIGSIPSMNLFNENEYQFYQKQYQTIQ